MDAARASLSGRRRAAAVVALVVSACGGDEPEDALPPPGPDLPYAKEIISFTPGPEAGFGQGRLPDVVLGPPQGGGTGAGSLDVLSLGVGGVIVLGFGDEDVVDGPGPDLVVFENAFWTMNDPTRPFAELGEVAVSVDGERWHVFPCDTRGDGRGGYPGCAGWTPTERFEAGALLPLDPARSGGDPFDLASLGLDRARFVRIRDLATDGSAPSAGFDLDAVGAVTLAPSTP